MKESAGIRYVERWRARWIRRWRDWAPSYALALELGRPATPFELPASLSAAALVSEMR